jgi:transposase
MKITGTREAFTRLIHVPAVNKILGVSRGTVANWKRAMEGVGEHNPPTLDKMEEMLMKYGAKVLKEKIWEFDS